MDGMMSNRVSMSRSVVGAGTPGGARRHRAFTLVEVNLAVLLVSVGLLVIFLLFPMGLRESEYGLVDTHEAMFADDVLNQMAGAVSSITDPSTWQNVQTFANALKLSGGMNVIIDQDDGTPHTISYPSILGASDDVLRTIRYRCWISKVTRQRDLMTVTLKVKSGKYGKFDLPTVFVTQFAYTGLGY